MQAQVAPIEYPFELEFDLRKQFSIGIEDFEKMEKFTQFAIISGLLQDISTQLGSTASGFRRPSSWEEQAARDNLEVFIAANSKPGTKVDIDRGFTKEALEGDEEGNIEPPNNHIFLLSQVFGKEVTE